MIMDRKILIVIVTYNGERWIERCIGSALRHGCGADILVVDNASTDGTLDLLPHDGEDGEVFAQSKRIKVISCEENLGFGAANNIGFQYAIENAYDYVYLLNQDAYLCEGALEKMLAVFQWNPQYGILSPMQVDTEGELDKQFRKKTGLVKVSKIDVPVPVNFVMAAHWLIPVSVLKRVGAFSPTFHHYGEDDNMVDRMHAFALQAGVVTSVTGIHDRASRKLTRDEQCTRKCLIPVIRMSRPVAPWGFLLSVLWLLGCSLKNFSLIPLKSVPVLWERRREIRSNRKASMQEGAFLKK